MSIRISAALAAIALSTMLSGCLTANPAAPDLPPVPEAACVPPDDPGAAPCDAATVDPAPSEATPPPSAAPPPAAEPAPAQPRRQRGRSAWNVE